MSTPSAGYGADERAFWDTLYYIRAKAEAGEPTPPHHHYAGGSHYAGGGHVTFNGLPAAGRECRSSSVNCHMALHAGTIIPCPACTARTDGQEEASDGR